MKGILITNKGIEDIAAKEVTELLKLKSKPEIKETAVMFEVKKLENLCLLCYRAQSAARVLLLLDELNITEDLEETLEIIEKSILKLKKELEKWLKNKSFKVECKRIGEHNFNSIDLSKEIGELIYEAISNKKVDTHNPDIVIYVYVYNNSCYLGIDFSGFDLSKREYKIFNHPESLKGNIAYALVRLTEYNKKDVLLDTYCKSGNIPIEAAIYATGFPLNFYRKEFLFQKFIKFDFEKENKKMKNDKLGINGFDAFMGNTTASKKNAKIAGVEKYINFARADVEWLDTKFDEGKVDKIVTKLPETSKNKNRKDIEKIYKEFFYQIDFVLNKKGRMVLITKDRDILEQEKGKFKIVEERIIYSGEMPLSISLLKR
jgi:tRNA (guanine6-N2)-methyltransferase